MDRPEWAPPGIDVERPSAARLYDYFLGGSHNFAADRAMAAQLLATAPDIPLIAQANRAFLRRAVHMLAESGIRQFLDIGSGIPTLGNVHEVAREIVPDARVVYVDLDPVAVAHSSVLIRGQEGVAAIQGDVRKPGDILHHEKVRELIDFTEPVALLILALLQFVRDEDDPAGIMAQLRGALPSGSYLALSHGVVDGWRHDKEMVKSLYSRTTTPAASRTRADVAPFFGDFELVDPGLVWVTQWRPDQPSNIDGIKAAKSAVVAGVGRKP